MAESILVSGGEHHSQRHPKLQPSMQFFNPWRGIIFARRRRRRAETGMPVPSIERLVLMVRENGRVVVNDDGIWQQRADGDPLLFADASGHKFSAPLPRAVFDAWRKVRFISQDMSVSADRGRVFALTQTGREVGTGRQPVLTISAKKTSADLASDRAGRRAAF
jgi:hypothetical protein